MNTSRFGRASRTEKSDDTDVAQSFMACSICGRSTQHKQLATLGARCLDCFAAYCRQAPAYMHSLDKYQGDPRAWAKRIMDKHNIGINVTPISLRFAREALGLPTKEAA